MECLWYNGELGHYELLDFDPRNLSKEEILKKATKELKSKFAFDDIAMKKALETLYTIKVKDLKKVGGKK